MCMAVTNLLKKLSWHVLMTLNVLQFKIAFAMVLEIFISVKGVLRAQTLSRVFV